MPPSMSSAPTARHLQRREVNQALSEKQLKRYLGDFDFRYKSRDVSNFERAAIAMKGAAGKPHRYA